VILQDRVELPPSEIVRGFALKVMTGAGVGLGGGGGGLAMTLTVTCELALPPGPHAFSVYVIVVDGDTERLPDVAVTGPIP
jgi:hypothetical protein